jgi:ABC-type transport system substrate-binding protein/DNA-binding SARP family transcriptional activator
MGCEFQILGPLEVRLDGTPVQIGGPRQRALLAMLLLSANRVVSRDRLIEELLPDAPADAADHQLRVQISRLRKALSMNGGNPTRLVTQAPGYVLEIAPGELDLHRFERLLANGDYALAEGDFEHAAATLREAESLWRGRPLADLEFEPFARVDIERLQDLRLAATENRVEAELALGRHAMLVPELEGLVAEYPLREGLRGQLMLALYRCGRQADALETYRSGRSLLSVELALEPSPALRQLERSILQQDAELDLPAPHSGPVTAAIAAQTQPATGPLPPDRDSSDPRRRKPRIILGAIALALVAALAAVTAMVAGGSRTLTAPANSVGVIDVSANTLNTVIPAGGSPGGIAVGDRSVWETDTTHDQLLQIGRSGRVMERIPVGRGPAGVAVGGGEVWVVNQLDRTVSEINPRALRPVASFPVGSGATAIAFGDNSVWVTDVVDDAVSRINLATGRALTIPLAGEPGGIAVGTQGVWVAGASTGQLLLIDPRTDQVTQQVSIGGSPSGVAIGDGSVWVANASDSTVSRFQPGSGSVRTFNVGKAPVGMAYGAGAVWAADSLGGTVTRIGATSGSVTEIHVGAAPTAVAVSRGKVWTTVLPGPAAHRGGTLTMVDGPLYASFGTSLEPAAWAGVIQWQALSMTNDGLVTYRRVGGLAGSTLVPDLATSLPLPTDNGHTYTFQLRRGIRYSDGAPVKPEDFQEEIERVFKLGNPYSESFYTGIVGAQRCVRVPRSCSLTRGIVADDRTDTVTFHLTAPDPDLLYKLAFPWADAVPADTPDRGLGRALPPATGPYVTSSVTPTRAIGEHGHRLAFGTWTLVRNRRFRAWNPAAQPNGYPNKIVLTNGENPGHVVSDVEHGRVDLLVDPPAKHLAELATHFTERFHTEPAPATFGFVLNTRSAPFTNVWVRRALNYAIDRRRIVGLAGGPRAAQPSCQILPPSLPGYAPYCPYTLRPGPGGFWRAPDLARARKLIDASGTRGMRVTVLVQPNDATSPTATMGPYLVSILDRLGYRASLRVTNSLYPTMNSSRSHTQIGWFTWYSDYPAPSDFFSVLLTCRSFLPDNPANTNDAEFCNHGIDKEISHARALQMASPGAANQAWRRVDQQVTDQAPWLPLYNPRVDVATSWRVGNYQYHPFFAVLPDQLWVR